MKTNLFKTVMGFAMVIALTVPSIAQVTYLRNIEVDNFNEIRVSLDTEVILLKSKRNHVTLVGDSAYVFSMPIEQNNDVLSFTYNSEPENKLSRVLIEYKDIDRLVTGGTGSYYLHNVEATKLDIFNPAAKLYISGKLHKMRLISENGTTDISDFQSREGILKIGETAQLVISEKDDFITPFFESLH